MVGKRFGRLVVLSPFDTPKRGSYWLCECDCGKTKAVSGKSLRTGHTKSCGCLHDELSSLRITAQNKRHGESKTRLYGIWVDMKKRCENKKHWAYSRYGGREICVCHEWQNYDIFASWAKGNGYDDTLTLDRKNNDGMYSPDNCRWVNRLVQARNKSNNRVYTYQGRTLTVAEWSEVTGINRSTLYGRLSRHNMDIKKALTKRPRKEDA